MSSRPSPSWIKWLVILVVVGAGAYFGYRYWARPSATALQYRTSPVTRGDIIQSVTANGSLSAVTNVQVGSQISGILKDIRVDFNSRVTVGEVIAQIDPATYERALVQAKAELANAEAGMQLARLNFDRSKELYANSLISKADFDTADVNLSQAKATVQTRNANVERAQVDLDRTTIYAPMDGIVISRKVEIGQTVAASLNTPTLFVIANDLSKMQIEAAVSEADVGGVEEGQNVSFTVEAFLNRTFHGVVRQVRYEPVTNQNVVSYTTVVAVDNADLKLRPGMTATASIITAERRGALRISNAALRFRVPEGAVVVGDTNAAAGATTSTSGSGTPEIATSGPFAGLPVPPWRAERRMPTEDERAKYEASLTAEQKAKYQAIMERFRARMAAGGGQGGGRGAGGAGGEGGRAGGGGGGLGAAGFGGGMGGSGARQRREQPEGPHSQTVYLAEKGSGAPGQPAAVLRAVTVRLGIADTENTEILSGLSEGDPVVTGFVTASAETASGPQNPFMPFGGRRRR